MQPDTMLNNRYRVIYAVDERPNAQLLRARDEQSGALMLLAVLPCTAPQRAALATLARQIAAVHHDLLLPLSDHFADDARYVLVCPDPGGQALEQALRAQGGPPAERETLIQATRLLQLVDLLHQQRPPLYLGDLLPSDVFVGPNGWQMLPFAMARLVSVTPSPYRAPELADQAVEPSGTTDTYAVAALLYHALTGYAPTAPEQQQAGVPLQAPRVLNPQLSPLVEQALLRGLQTKPGNRYQNARELRLALETVSLMAGRSLGLGPDVVPAETAPAAAETSAAIYDTRALAPVEIPYDTPVQPIVQQGYTVAAPQSRRGLSTGCLIALAVGVVVLAIGIAAALVFALVASGSFAGLGNRLAAAGAENGPIVPIAPNAITLTNIKTITQTSEITSELFGPINYSPDGKQIALGISSSVSLNDASMHEQHRLIGHTGDVIGVAFSPDGKLLASSAQGDPVARIWDTATGKQVRMFKGHSDWLRSVVFSPDGKLLATGSVDKTVRLWNVADGSLLSTLEGYTDFVGSLAFSPSGSLLASTARDGTVRLWNVATSRPQAGFDYSPRINPTDNKPIWTTGVAFSPDPAGKRLAVGGYDGTITLIDAQTGTVERRMSGHKGPVVLRGVVFARDGKTLFSASTDGTVRQWDVETGTELGQFEGHNLTVIGIALSPDGNQLASSSTDEGSIIVWKVADRTKINELRGGQGLVTSLAYSPEGRALALTGYNGALRLQPTDGKPAQTSPSGTAQRMAFMRNGIGMVSDQGDVRLVTANKDTTPLDGLGSKASAMAASRSGSVLAAGSTSGTIALWDEQGRARRTLASELPSIGSLALSDDGRYLAAGGGQGVAQIEIWDTASGKRVQTLVGLRDSIVALAFQPGGTHVVGSDLVGAAMVWNAPDGKLLNIMNATADQGHFNALAFSPDGKLLVGGAQGGSIVAWSSEDGAEAAQIALGGGGILALAFSPNGQQLAVSVHNESASVYTLEVPQ